MSKGSFEFVDITLLKQRETELLEREEKEQTKVFKICQRCGIRKPLLQFSTDRRNTNGKTSICKECKIIEYLGYYYQNRDRILIVHKKYRDDHKGVRTKYFENYKRLHKEHLQKVAASWYKKNKRRLKERRLKLKVNLK